MNQNTFQVYSLHKAGSQQRREICVYRPDDILSLWFGEEYRSLYLFQRIYLIIVRMSGHTKNWAMNGYYNSDICWVLSFC